MKQRNTIRVLATIIIIISLVSACHHWCLENYEWIDQNIIFPLEHIDGFSDGLKTMIQEVYHLSIPDNARFLHGTVAPGMPESYLYLSFSIPLKKASEDTVYQQICDKLGLGEHFNRPERTESLQAWRDDIIWVTEIEYTYSMECTTRPYTRLYYAWNSENIFFLLTGYNPPDF